MFGLGIFEILFLVLVVGGFTIWLHPALLTGSGYSECLTGKRVTMAVVRIIVWFIFLALAMPKTSGEPTASQARATLGTMLGAALLTWILFRLPQAWRAIRKAEVR